MKIVLIIVILSYISCQNNSKVKSSYIADKFQISNGLDDYWYKGKAEISTYTIAQNRYKDVHPGESILIFVTEDFLTDKQVKNDNYKNQNSTPILKCNNIKRFTTGIYDYSVMTSIFTPVDREGFPHTLKVTMSSQDWCGQSYHQLNYENGFYHSQLHSYFENEADRKEKISKAILEDELFNLCRFGPESLPKGNVSIIPSLEYLRFKHKKVIALDALATIDKYVGDEWGKINVLEYILSFPTEKRELKIFFEQEKPYKILGWDDSYPSVFDDKPRTTKARKKNESYVAYWELNNAENNNERKKLGLK
jgi:hypothetical protein